MLLTNLQNNHDPIRFLATADLAASTKKQYGRALRLYLGAGHSVTDGDQLARYAMTVPESERRFLSAAVVRWCGHVSGELKRMINPALATPQMVAQMQAALWSLEALAKSIPSPSTKDTSVGIWLEPAEVVTMVGMAKKYDSLKMMAHRVILSVLLGAGLRCSEATGLIFDQIEILGDRPVLQIDGKGGKKRTVPISSALSSLLGDWRLRIAAGGGDRVLRSCHGSLGDSISQRAVGDRVASYGEKIGRSGLKPHDLRRTYARIGYDNTKDLYMISRLLGHSKPETTARYLGVGLDFDVTASDFVPI